ncbi:MAG: hypothetical protein IRY87_24640 [Acetobacteraceae bacterium]|nr:hypothetical protein [Acetobacteraceae bacterium]
MSAKLPRRAALAAPAAFVVATMPAVAAVSPDAELLAACEELQDCYRHLMALNAADDTPDEVGDAAIQRWHQAQERVSDLPATTPAGVRAKAAALMAVIRHDVVVKIGGTVEEYAVPHEWLAYRLAEDIVALAGGAA